MNREGQLILDGGLLPYKRGSLDVAHAKKYWSHCTHILPESNLNCFPAITEENIQDFNSRLHLMRQDLRHIGRASFKGAIVEALNISGQTNRQHPIIGMADVEELMHNLERSTLRCLQIN